jgi:hypothetical protein
MMTFSIRNAVKSDFSPSFYALFSASFLPNPPPAPRSLAPMLLRGCGVGARIPKVWANARAACPDEFLGSGAPHQDRGAIIFPERTWSCPDDAVLGALKASRKFIREGKKRD